jgi:hypothetical protein
MQLKNVLEDMETIVIAIGTWENDYAAIHKSVVGKIRGARKNHSTESRVNR